MSDLISTQDAVAKVVDYAIRNVLSGEQKLTKEYEQSVKEAVNVILDTAKRTDGDLISRQAAIDALEDTIFTKNEILRRLSELPPAHPEQLTDNEQRIFLAAMGREEMICKQVEDKYKDCRDPNEDSLVRICHEITRKVKGALWET